MALDVGLRALIEPEVDEREARKATEDLAEEFEEVEELEIDADLEKVEDALEDLEADADVSSIEDALEDLGTEVDITPSDQTSSGVMGTAMDSIEAFDNDDGGIMSGLSSAGGTMQKSGKAGGLASKLGGGLQKFASSGLLKVTLAGAVGYGLLKGVQKMASASPAMGKTADMFGQAMDLFFRPFGNFLGNLLRPMSEGLLNMASNLNRHISEDGLIIGGLQWLKDAIIGLPANLSEVIIQTIGEGLEGLLPGDIFLDEFTWEQFFEDAIPHIPEFPDWESVFSFMDDINVAGFPGWDQVFDVFDQLEMEDFPGWNAFIPEIDWNLSGFSWNDFIPSIEWSLPDFPGWSDLVNAIPGWPGGGGGDDDGDEEGSTDTSGGDGSSGGSDPSEDGGDGSNGGGDGSGRGSGGGHIGPPSLGGGNRSPIRGMATGGIVQDRTEAVVGEQGPEAIIPLDRLSEAIGASESQPSTDAREIAQSTADAAPAAADGSLGEVETLLRDLLRAIEDIGGDVYLDRKKVGKVFQRNETRQRRQEVTE